MERIGYNLFFRSLTRLGIALAMWNHSMFSKSRDRLLIQTRTTLP